MSALDKFGPITNYRIPPQSTGTAIAHRRSFWLLLSGLMFSQLKEGQPFTLSNGTTGTLLNFAETKDGTGQILAEAKLDRNSNFDVVVGTIDINGVQTGTVEQFKEVFVPTSTIVDGEISTNALRIDKSGSANVRFSGGDPYVDTFSNLKVSTGRNLGSYSFFDSSTFPASISQIVSGGGTINLDPVAGVLNMDVGTAAGDSAIAITDNYHKYYKGFETLALISGFSGDSGKTGVVRRWGIFDDEDGIYFEQNGNDLFVVLRSSTSGAVQEIRVARENWNGDRVDGSETLNNVSGFDIKLNANNLYTIAYSWLGSGSAKLGLQGNFSSDILLHSFEETHNVSPNAFMRNPNLPLRFEIFNEVQTASPSRYSIICASVESNTNIIQDREDSQATLSTWNIDAPKTVTETPTLIVAARVKSTDVMGFKNRIKVVPLKYMVNNPSDRPILMEIRFGGDTDTTTWVGTGSLRDTIEINTSATTITGIDVPIQTDLLMPGANTIDVSNLFSSKGQFISPKGNGDPSNILTFRARLLEGGLDTSSDVRIGINWIEV